jgi:hypothetical protein
MDAFLFAGVSVLLLVLLGGLTSSVRLRTRRR